eukprot:2869460-Pleurochrysis_carterae.AAC.1
MNVVGEASGAGVAGGCGVTGAGGMQCGFEGGGAAFAECTRACARARACRPRASDAATPPPSRQ